MTCKSKLRILNVSDSEAVATCYDTLTPLTMRSPLGWLTAALLCVFRVDQPRGG